MRCSSFCWSMFHILLFYLIMSRLVYLIMSGPSGLVRDTVTYVLAFYYIRRFKFKTGLLSISDQHLLKIKNHCIHNASTWGNGKNRLLRGDSTLKNWIVWIVYLFFPYLNLARLYSVILTVLSYVRITILEH